MSLISGWICWHYWGGVVLWFTNSGLVQVNWRVAISYLVNLRARRVRLIKISQIITVSSLCMRECTKTFVNNHISESTKTIAKAKTKYLQVLWNRAPIKSDTVSSVQFPSLLKKVCEQVTWLPWWLQRDQEMLHSEINLRSPFHIGDEACKEGDSPWLWCHQNSIANCLEKRLKSTKNEKRKTQTLNLWVWK